MHINLNETFAKYSLPDMAEYFDIGDNRYKHILGVGRLMEELMSKTSNLNHHEKEWAIQAAYLHDIGYSKRLQISGFHPYDGYVYCMENGYSDTVAKAVLLHSDAVLEMLIKGWNFKSLYSDVIRSLTSIEKEVFELVTFCDIHTQSTGVPCTIEERLRDVLIRYPNDETLPIGFFLKEARLKQLEDKYAAQLSL